MIASIRLFFVCVSCLVYLSGTSVFSHMLIMQDHHAVEISEHSHENWNSHDHIENVTCSSVDCYVDCTSIERIKVTNLSSWPKIHFLEIISHIFTTWCFDWDLRKTLQLKTYSKLSISDHFSYRSKFLEFADLVGIILITS